MSLKLSENNLKELSSKYLQQHAENPVNWQTYSPEVIELAKQENKPLFISIGYSSCHWCHVMAHESFEDNETAKLLNENFIPVKVDREEFPDLDQYLQLACQVMNGQGGWPLSAFVTPDFKPYFVGTYFPLTPMQNLPSFKDVILNLGRLYKEDIETLEENASKVLEAITSPPKSSQEVKFEGHYPGAPSVLDALKNYFDQDNGGFGGAPKFPQFSFYEWMCEQALEGVLTKEQVEHLVLSVESMISGGVSDQLRGGIHRYSVDEKWLIPHFEKMLYDQAGLLRVLVKLSLIYPSPLVLDTLLKTLDYLEKEMLDEKGFFFSAQDADSEGVEGLYFTFTKDEFIDALTSVEEKLTESHETYLKWFGITESGNFERGLNVVSLQTKHKDEYYAPEAWEQVREIKQALLKERQQRIPPQTDRKGIASWNFQVLSSLLDVLQYSRIDIIKNAALNLLVKTHSKLAETFITVSDDCPLTIKSVTTKENHGLLFEDYVSFAELSFRAYELFANSNDLDNGYNSLKFILKNFYKDEVFHTRLIKDDKLGHRNIYPPIGDQSYKSPLGTYIYLLRKWQTVFPDLIEDLNTIKPSIENLTHISLQNPLAFGETLRALTYPTEAYKKIEVPFFWIKNAEFQKLQNNFPGRFAVFFHEDEAEKWSICRVGTCEVEGEGLDDFKKIFTPQQVEQSH